MSLMTIIELLREKALSWVFFISLKSFGLVFNRVLSLASKGIDNLLLNIALIESIDTF